jgi:hypothetical protein
MNALLRAVPVALLSSVMLWSCAPRGTEIMLDTRATPFGELRLLVEQKGERLHTLQGSGSMSFDTPEISGDAAFIARLKRPDSLLVFLEGPFGIDIGTLFLSRERYLVYNSLENRVVTGNPAAGSFRSVIPFELTYEQLLNAFAGVFQLPDQQPELYEVRESSFFLSFACGTSKCEYWVDPELLMVTRFRSTDPAGNVIIEASCTSPVEDDEAAAPRKILVRFPGEQRRLSIDYSRITLNDPDLSFDFSIPKNARTTVR